MREKKHSPSLKSQKYYRGGRPCLRIHWQEHGLWVIIIIIMIVIRVCLSFEEVGMASLALPNLVKSEREGATGPRPFNEVGI